MTTMKNDQYPMTNGQFCKNGSWGRGRAGHQWRKAMNGRIMIHSLSWLAVLLLLTPLCARASRGESANYVLISAWVEKARGQIFILDPIR